MSFKPASIHPDLIQCGPHHYRMGLVHFEWYKIATQPCSACNGTGKDPSNKRRKCRACWNSYTKTAG